jgi:hypothetical protein
MGPVAPGAVVEERSSRVRRGPRSGVGFAWSSRRTTPHCAEQVFYFDDRGCFRRLDYTPDAVGGAVLAAHCYEHEDFSGLVVPTRRRVFGRREDGTAGVDHAFVELDVTEVALS